jgi:hypothetical protein
MGDVTKPSRYQLFRRPEKEKKMGQMFCQHIVFVTKELSFKLTDLCFADHVLIITLTI